MITDYIKPINNTVVAIPIKKQLSETIVLAETARNVSTQALVLSIGEGIPNIGTGELIKPFSAVGDVISYANLAIQAKFQIKEIMNILNIELDEIISWAPSLNLTELDEIAFIDDRQVLCRWLPNE